MSTKRFLCNLITLLLIYFNVAFLGTEACRRLELPFRAPLGIPVGAVFNVFPVFTHYLQYNVEVVLEGLPEDAAEGADAEWIRLNIAEYLPYRRGDLYSRVIGTLGHPVTGPPRDEWLAAVARKIRERHNRRSARDQIQAIRFRTITWPRSTRGYSAMRNQDTESTTVIYSEKPLNDRDA